MDDHSESPRQGAPADRAVGLHEYLRVVRHRKWIILAAVILVPLGAVIYSLQQTPVYEASAKVLLSRQNLAGALTGVLDPTASVDNATLVQTQADVARVPEIADRAIAELGQDVTQEEFLANGTVTATIDSEILTFTYRDTDAELAAEAAGAYAEGYVDYRRELDTASLKSARREVTDRIEQLAEAGEQDGALYASLVKREQQLQALEALQIANARVIQTPGPGEQVSPKPLRNGVLGLLLGGVIGLGLAFLREALDTRMRSADQISRALHLPLLSRIPTPPKKLRDENGLVTMAEPRGAGTEAFRMLRTSLQFAMLDRNIRSIMVTSALPREGKSTTIANLALTCARAGQHVVLVDLDLRRPRLQRFFDLRDHPGVTQVVLKQVSLDAALAQVPLVLGQAGEHEAEEPVTPDSQANGGAGRLEVLTSGRTPPDPGEFVASRGLAQMLGLLNEHADLVLIDSPPLLHIGDAMTLSTSVDGLVVVAQMQMLRRGVLGEAHRILATSRAHQLGFVLVGAKGEAGYGYGYGYGTYGTQDDTDDARSPRRRRGAVSRLASR